MPGLFILTNSHDIQGTYLDKIRQRKKLGSRRVMDRAGLFRCIFCWPGCRVLILTNYQLGKEVIYLSFATWPLQIFIKGLSTPNGVAVHAVKRKPKNNSEDITKEDKVLSCRGNVEKS